MNALKRLEQLERMIDGLHREALTVYFDNGDVARMPLGEVIPMHQQDAGISRVSDNGTDGNGVLCDLINDLLEDGNE